MESSLSYENELLVGENMRLEAEIERLKQDKKRLEHVLWHSGHAFKEATCWTSRGQIDEAIQIKAAIREGE